MKILLVGGGSGGVAAPLIAVAEQAKIIKPDCRFVLIGTKKGPEQELAKNAKIPFYPLISGKWRRYFSLQNFFAPFLTIFGFFQALKILKETKPNCIFGAGSFAQVPIVWAGKFLGIPSVIHQQDIAPSLANKICDFAAKKITVCFEKSITDFGSGAGFFYSKKQERVIQTGNPFRQNLMLFNKSKAYNLFKLHQNLPVLLVLGGGTGSEFINQLILKGLPELCKTVQVIHSFGQRNPIKFKHENYHPFAFIADMAGAYAVSDIVISRAGLSTLTELSNLKKVSIIIPIPNSHQEYNAALLREMQAALVFYQHELNSNKILQIIRKILFEHSLQKKISENISKIMPKNSAKKIAEILFNVIEEYEKK